MYPERNREISGGNEATDRLQLQLLWFNKTSVVE